MAITTFKNTRLGAALPGTKVPTSLDIDWGDAAVGGATGLTEEDTTRGTSGLGSILSGQASLQRAAIERAKAEAEARAAAAAITRAQQGAAAQAAYLRSQLGAGIPTAITGEISAQEAAGQKYIQDTAAELLKQLQSRQALGEQQTQAGYSGLMNYLARTQPTAFAQAQRAVPTIAETGLGQYMAGQGVSPAAAQEAVRLANIQAAGGATNYNQLLNVLAAREAAAQESRQAEAQMGLSSSLANLQALYGAGASQLEQQRLAALQELATTISNARLQASREAAARDQAIQDALGSLFGSGYVKPEDVGIVIPPAEGTEDISSGPAQTPTPTETAPRFGRTPEGFVTSPAVSALLDTAAARRTDKPTALTNRIWNFVEANPGATKKQVLDEFPNLKGLDSLKTKKKK